MLKEQTYVEVEDENIIKKRKKFLPMPIIKKKLTKNFKKFKI